MVNLVNLLNISYLFIFVVFSLTNAQTAIHRINVGGPSYTDSSGETWSADYGYNGGIPYQTIVGITGTSDQTLYQTERWDPSTGEELIYNLPVATEPTTYQVVLYFADIYSGTHGVDKRVFDVTLEDQPFLNRLDIFSEVGGYAALIKNTTVNVTDGTLTIKFIHQIENPKISAIEVLTLPQPDNGPPIAIATAFPTSGDKALVVNFNASESNDPEGNLLSYEWDFGDGSTATTVNPLHVYENVGTYTATLTVHDGTDSNSTSLTITVTDGHNKGSPIYCINAGGPDYTDQQGGVWSADDHYNGGSVFGTTNFITGTNDPVLFQTERWGPGWQPELHYSFPVSSTPTMYQVVLYFADIYSGTHAENKRVFDIEIEGSTIFKQVDIYSEVGGYAAMSKSATLLVSDGNLDIRFLHQIENPKISAIKILIDQSTSIDLHVVIVAPTTVIDYDQNGEELIIVDGTDSHTHEPGRVLALFEWTKDGTPFANTQIANTSLPIGGPYTIALTITDDDTPPDSLTDYITVQVRNPNDVPGNLILYSKTEQDPTTLLDEEITKIDFGEITETLNLDSNNGKIGNSPFNNNLIAQWLFQIDIDTEDTYHFLLEGGSNTRLYLEGAEVNGPIPLTATRHSFEARFAITSISQLPTKITFAQGSGQYIPINPTIITHNETGLKPIINSLPTTGPTVGGDTVAITGLGFFPYNDVVVNWGSTTISNGDLVVTSSSIRLQSPPGTDGTTVSVTVSTPNGVSNNISYTYASNIIPINFVKSKITNIDSPTSAEWGPDSRLYVATISGVIKAFSFDDNYAITATQTVTTMTTLSNPVIMGLAFNPHQTGEVKIYISHGTLYANGGGCFTGTSIYSGQVSTLTGPNFDVVQPVITGLPVSNHDHLVNGMQFDNNGDLYLAVGGNTNAGVEACAIGGIPESPLSAAIIKVHLTHPDFNGAVTYRVTATGIENNDQVSGEIVDLDKTVSPFISIFSSGLRNPWDIVFTTQEDLFATDNGPNVGFGGASLSPTTQGPDPYGNDELLALKKGRYFGHPNRNRGRYDYRENVYRGESVVNLPGEVFTQCIVTFAPSTNGIVEYRANTFNGAMRGDLLLQKWNDQTYRVTLSSNRESYTTKTTLPVSLTSLDVTVGPGGVVFGTGLSDNSLWIAKPDDASVGSGHLVYDITPWRAPTTGGNHFVIGGNGFGTLATTTVKIGTITALLTSVTSTRIKGVIPLGWGGTLLDIEVTVGGVTKTLSKAFRYLDPPSSHPVDGRWITGPDMPISVGEVAAGLVNGQLYLIGHSTSATLKYDTTTGNWDSTSCAVRLYQGDHHGVEVVDGKLLIFGGSGASVGKVQIYNPITNSWSLGTSMPWNGFSVSTATINGIVYVAGGIVGSSTVTNHAKYDPVTNSWTTLAPMPQGRNHAASATDGEKFYVFGGRGAGSGDGNYVANGFDTVQIYHPATDTWTSSLDTGSTLLPLPQKRGGMGKAVYHQREFYVIGGETLTGTGATANKVYDRVDVYDPVSNTWRLETSMPTARHGVFPILVGERIFVAGGGTSSGHSSSNKLEIMAP